MVNRKLMLSKIRCLVLCKICIADVECIVSISMVKDFGSIVGGIGIYRILMFCPNTKARDCAVCVCNLVDNIILIEVTLGDLYGCFSVRLEEIRIGFIRGVVVVNDFNCRSGIVNAEVQFIVRRVECSVIKRERNLNVITVVGYINHFRHFRYKVPIHSFHGPAVNSLTDFYHIGTIKITFNRYGSVRIIGGLIIRRIDFPGNILNA